MSTKKHDYWWKINEGLKMISSLVDNQRPCQTSTADSEEIIIAYTNRLRREVERGVAEKVYVKKAESRLDESWRRASFRLEILMT